METGSQQLLLAAERGDLKLIEELLGVGIDANIESEDGEGWTALIMASKEGHTDVVQALLAAKANPNPNRISHTAIRGAALGGFTRVAEILLSAKADPNFPSAGLRTPLMGAAMNGNEDVAITLLQAKANMTIKNDYGEDAMELAKNNGHEVHRS